MIHNYILHGLSFNVCMSIARLKHEDIRGYFVIFYKLIRISQGMTSVRKKIIALLKHAYKDKIYNKELVLKIF